MTKPTDATVTAWARLLRAHRTAVTGVERRLKEAGLPGLDWYDALLELRRASEGLRPQDLEKEMLLPQYNISRLADRLEQAGYIKKSIDPDDARAKRLTITGKGRALLKRMWPVYAAAIEEHLGKRVTASEAKALATILGKLR